MARPIMSPTGSWMHSTMCWAISTRYCRRYHDRRQPAGERGKISRRVVGAKGRQERRRPRRADFHDAGWRGARLGRRPQLRRQPVQPRGRRQAPAGLSVQTVRLSDRARTWAYPETVREDKPINIKGWQPENYGHEYFGPVTLTKGLAMSLNTVSVRLTMEFSPMSVIRTAHRLGIASKLEPNASIALGTSEVSILELIGAYAPSPMAALPSCRMSSSVSAAPPAKCSIRAANSNWAALLRPAMSP